MKLEFTQPQACFFMVFIGLLFVAAGVVLLRRRKSKLAGLTMPVTARVTDVLKEERTEWKEGIDGTKSSHTRIVYRPILEYEVGGRIYKKPHTVNGLAGQLKVGTTLEILCNPSNPPEACSRSGAGGFALPVAAIVIGVGIALIGTILLCR